MALRDQRDQRLFLTFDPSLPWQMVFFYHEKTALSKRCGVCFKADLELPPADCHSVAGEKVQRACRVRAGRGWQRPIIIIIIIIIGIIIHSFEVLRAQHKWATMLLSFFECFPYVCPEPVLVKRSLIY
eukprot:COSAG06_NODE_1780_length_8407_cov_3.654230_13_plen_127_part_01